MSEDFQEFSYETNSYFEAVLTPDVFYTMFIKARSRKSVLDVTCTDINGVNISEELISR